jgi:retron-type reverse transcriptase
MVNKIKSRIEGPCATEWEKTKKFPSLYNRKISDTCALVIESLLYLCDRVFEPNVTKTIDGLKIKNVENISNLQYPVSVSADKWLPSNSYLSISYVLPTTLIGRGTRRFVNGDGWLKANKIHKGPVLTARYLSTKGPSKESSVDLEEEFMKLKSNSIKNSMIGVNNSINILIRSQIFWIHCYESIKSNPGSMSLGGGDKLGKTKTKTKTKTLDGINLEFFDDLVKKVGSGRFVFGNTRRTLIRRPDGKQRPLGIADSRDKIVQKGMAVILELVSEHRFCENSFGFRRGRSCHDAIAFIKKKVPSGLYAIEGDISKCFDSFNHRRLASIVKKKYISHQIFLDLLHKALKVRIISLDSNFKNKVGTPQGSVVSPILCNIYLNELDDFILKGSELKKYRDGKGVTTNPKFTKYLKFTQEEMEECLAVKRSKGKLKFWKHASKIRRRKINKATIEGIPRKVMNKNNIRIQYVRYADDFIIFVWGTMEDCIEIKRATKNFLDGCLDLQLSTVKTKITYLKKDKAEFLGFQLWQTNHLLDGTKKDINPLGIRDRSNMDTKYRGAVAAIPRLRVTFSMSKVLRELVDKQLIRYKNGKFFPTSYKPALSYDIANIVVYIRQIFLGLANYYSFSDNWYDAKTLYNYYGLFCTAMTIAHKTKSKVPKVFKKYGSTLEIKNSNNKVVAKFPKIQ